MKKIGRGKYRIINPFISFEDFESVYIEAKLSNWKKGIRQCIEGKTIFNKVYLGVPETKVHLLTNFEEFSKNGIGLIGSGEESKIIWEAKSEEVKDKELKRVRLEVLWYRKALVESGIIQKDTLIKFLRDRGFTHYEYI